MHSLACLTGSATVRFCTRANALAAAAILLGASRNCETERDQTHSLQTISQVSENYTHLYTFPYLSDARPITLWPVFLGYLPDRRNLVDIVPCDCVIPFLWALHCCVKFNTYTLSWILDAMFGLSSRSSWDSFLKRAACSLSFLALIGSGGVSAQLNNETSPTHQFKSVGALSRDGERCVRGRG